MRCGFFLGANNENAGETLPGSAPFSGTEDVPGPNVRALLVSDRASRSLIFVNWAGPGRSPSTPMGCYWQERSRWRALPTVRSHLLHVSRRAEIALIRAAKERGAAITCEVTPHHLFLTERDAKALGSLGYMKPTLGTEADRQALWDHCDVIDIVASDHAPHTKEEKASENPPPGSRPGNTLPLLLTAVHEGRIPIRQVVKWLSQNPASIYCLKQANRHRRRSRYRS